MMEKYSLQEKYDFIMQRIVQITRSEAGYMALVNTGQTQLSLCSFFSKNPQRPEAAGSCRLNESRRVEDGGLPGDAVMQKKAIINNAFVEGDNGVIYPYQLQVRRHLDVPIYNSGKIVIVAGVCNNSSDYDNSDLRQMAMAAGGHVAARPEDFLGDRDGSAGTADHGRQSRGEKQGRAGSA